MNFELDKNHKVQKKFYSKSNKQTNKQKLKIKQNQRISLINSISIKQSIKNMRSKFSDDNCFLNQSKITHLRKNASQTCISNTHANNKSDIYYDESLF